MTNTNCLSGMRCPQCANEASLRIEARIVCAVTDDGSEPTGDHHWDDDSFCHCPDCEFEGKVKDFYPSAEGAASPRAQTYRFRAECWADVESLMEMLSGSVEKIDLTIEPPFPDVEVNLVTDLALDELRAAMSRVTDGHIMVETLARSGEYTGVRRRAA
jgi:hypothetical protein